MSWESNHFGCQLIWDSSDLDVTWFEIQVIWDANDSGCEFVWDSIDLAAKWFEIQVGWLSVEIWDSNELVVNWCVIHMILVVCWFEIQVSWLSIVLRFKWFGCQTIWDSNDLVVNWFEIHKRSFCARLPSKMTCRPDTWPQEFQYVLVIFERMLQKYCACPEKVEPRHTNSCNYHAKWSLQSNVSVTWDLQPFHGFCVGGFKHRHHKARNPCACLQIHHACQRFLLPSTLTNSCTCHVFCNVSKSLRLPREKHFEPPKTPRAPGVLTILASKSLSRRHGANFAELNFLKCSAAWCLFFAEIALARRRGANMCKFFWAQLPKVLRHRQFLTILTSKSLSRAGVVQILSTSWAADPPRPPVLRSWLSQPAKPQNYGKTQHFAQFLTAKIIHVSHLCCKTSLLSNIDAARPSGNFQYSRKLELQNFLW